MGRKTKPEPQNVPPTDWQVVAPPVPLALYEALKEQEGYDMYVDGEGDFCCLVAEGNADPVEAAERLYKVARVIRDFYKRGQMA